MANGNDTSNERPITRSGIELQPYYMDADEKAERPGEFPYTRGRRATAASGWIHRELSGEGPAKKSNEQFKYLIEHGSTGLDVIGDAGSAAGLDPDHPLARVSCGTQGVSVCRRQDMTDLLRDIPLDKVSISCSLNPLTTVAATALAAEELNFPLEKMRGSLIHAPLYVESCCYAIHFPVEFRTRVALDSIEFCSKYMPKYHSYIEDTYFFSESGNDPVEEMALGFLQIRFLTRRLLERGLDIDSFAPRIAILVNCGMDFFEEIAKIRATRRIFAKMMRDEFGAKDPRSLAVVVTSHTSGLSLTAQQPANNIIRGSMQAMALALAGVQAMEISTFDEAFRTPSPEAHMVGLRTQQVLSLEALSGQVADPLGGSYFVESLTDEMEARIVARVAEFEAMGDPEELEKRGVFEEVFHNAMAKQQRDVAKGRQPLVGVNCHTLPDDQDTLLRDVAERKIEPYQAHVDDIIAWKETRQMDQVKEALNRFADVVAGDANIVEAVRDALRADVTFGELKGTARQALGLDYDYYGRVEPLLKEVA